MAVQKTGVLLFNLGGPETLEDVGPFLYNLFSDPEIIRIKSGLLRKMLAWFLASVRQNRSRNLYRRIGGGSPLRRITAAQAAGLASELSSKGLDAAVYIGMLCWKPGIEEAVRQILQDGIDRLILLPLFPQFSITTTGACLRRFQALDHRLGLSSRMDIRTVKAWYDEPLYIESMADLIREGMKLFSGSEYERVSLLYSAHSIPARYAQEGDPYPEQMQRCIALIDARVGGSFRSLPAFQSRVGPVRWLRPSTKEMLQELGRGGCDRVFMVPISFVSDNLETLYEMDIEYRELAARSGIKEFHRIPALNLRPKFIEALARIALREAG